MTKYSVGDVERLLGLKVHIIRYWERAVPLIQPKRDNGGRRRYSNRDLQILLRVKHLIQERHFTLEGARDQLFLELSGNYQDLRSQIAALRAGLVDLYFLAHSQGEGVPGGPS